MVVFLKSFCLLQKKLTCSHVFSFLQSAKNPSSVRQLSVEGGSFFMTGFHVLRSLESQNSGLTPAKWLWYLSAVVICLRKWEPTWAGCNHVQINAPYVMNIKNHKFTLSTYSWGASPLHCVLRICLVSVAVPLQVPNPRRLVCLQHRSRVWSQPRSSSRHTCSALAQCSLTNRLKVSSPPNLTLFTFTYTCTVILATSAYRAHAFAPLVYVNLLQWVIHLNFCWILPKLCELSRRGGMWDVKLIANKNILRDYHVTTSDGARWNVTEILSSHPLSLLFLQLYFPALFPIHSSSVCRFYETKHACEEKPSSWHSSLYFW